MANTNAKKKTREGCVQCDKCNGTGKIWNESDYPHGLRYMTMCDKCLGDGQLDWIERAVGKRKKERWLNVEWSFEMQGDIKFIYQDNEKLVEMLSNEKRLNR